MNTGSNASAESRHKLATLRSLARPSATARWSGDGAELFVDNSTVDANAKPLRTPAAVVSLLHSLGLVSMQEGCPAITSAGRAWLRRQLASDDPFLAQHRETQVHLLRAPSGEFEPVAVNDAESPLAWLRQRKDRSGVALLDEAQYSAGERLRRDFTFAALSPRVTANWSNSASAAASNRGGVPSANMRDDVVAAKARVNRALGAVGPELGRMLVDVCCLLKGIESAETSQGLPRRSGKVVLQLGLSALARHYGLSKQVKARQGASAEILHWGSSDFRPAI
jgi:Domain of unknown function (DUF6456)